MDPSTRQYMYDNFDSEYYVVGRKHLMGPQKEFVSDWMFDLFSKGIVKGETLLDIGTGPDINTALYAYPYFSKIYLSDYSRNNLQYLEEWVQGEHTDAVRCYVEGAIKREGSTVSQEEKQNELRSKIAEILYCDVNQKNPIGANPSCSKMLFDVVMAGWCLTAAVNSEEEYFDALQNIVSLIKPGGHLVLMEVYTDCGKYDVNGVEYPCFAPSDEKVKAFFDKSYRCITPFVQKNFPRGEKIVLYYFNIAVQTPQ